MQRNVPIVDRQAVHPLELVGQADAQSRLRPLARRPVVVPSPAAEAVAARVPADERQEDDAARRHAKLLGGVGGGDVPLARDELPLAPVANEIELFARHARQADGQAEALGSRDDRRRVDLAVVRAVGKDCVAPLQEPAGLDTGGDGRRRGVATGVCPARTAQGGAYRLLVNHPFRSANGTDTSVGRLNSVVSIDQASRSAEARHLPFRSSLRLNELSQVAVRMKSDMKTAPGAASTHHVRSEFSSPSGAGGSCSNRRDIRLTARSTSSCDWRSF